MTWFRIEVDGVVYAIVCGRKDALIDLSRYRRENPGRRVEMKKEVS
jgi:hypothetical protein